MLPYGYTVSLILCYNPFVWKKVIDPCADATNKGEKVPEELKKQLDQWIMGTLGITAVVLTYFTFFVVGFEERKY